MNKQLELAIAQFTGWHHAKMNGDRILDLVQSMGLKRSEWTKIRPDVSWLNEVDKQEIDEYFNKPARTNKN